MHLHSRDLKPTEDGQALGRQGSGESADLLQCNPLYNVHRQQDLRNSDHDVFDSKNMEAFCDFAKCVTKSEGLEHIFCPAVRLVSCWRVFALAWKRWTTILEKLVCSRWNRRHYSTVVSTIPTCKTHDGSLNRA